MFLVGDALVVTAALSGNSGSQAAAPAAFSVQSRTTTHVHHAHSFGGAHLVNLTGAACCYR